MRHYQRGIATTVILILFLIVGVATVSGYFIFYQNQAKSKSVNSFKDCAKYYPVMESYPEQCNTPDGKHFVRELSDEEKKKLIPPGGSVGSNSGKICAQVITPAKNSQTNDCKEFPTPCDVPEGWETVGDCSLIEKTRIWNTYKNSIYRYSVMYPSSATLVEAAEGRSFLLDKNIFMTTIRTQNTSSDWYQLNISVSDVPEGTTEEMLLKEYKRTIDNMEVKDKQSQYIKEALIEKYNKSLSKYNNGQISGTHVLVGYDYEHEIIFEVRDGKLYEFFYTIFSGSQSEIDKILLSFKFL